MTLNEATQLLHEHEYPTTADQLTESHGDFELQLPNGTETLAEVFARLGPETYEQAQDAEHAMYSGVSSKAIGRKNYSDRDPTTLGTLGPDQISF